MHWKPQQVGGDMVAAEYGATFGGWMHTIMGEHDSYRVVEIRNLETEFSNFKHGAPPYVAWQGIYNRGDLGSTAANEAIRAMGVAPDYQWTMETIFLALFTYGHRVDPIDPYDIQHWPTLRAAMEALDIPREALWDQEQYERGAAHMRQAGRPADSVAAPHDMEGSTAVSSDGHAAMVLSCGHRRQYRRGRPSTCATCPRGLRGDPVTCVCCQREVCDDCATTAVDGDGESRCPDCRSERRP